MKQIELSKNKVASIHWCKITVTGGNQGKGCWGSVTNLTRQIAREIWVFKKDNAFVQTCC